jgi:hypothetical protein
MSILIIGADRIGALVPRLERLGASRITHWSARTQKTAKNTIPAHIELVVFFTDFLHHTAARKLKSQVKQLGLPALYCRRCWSELADQLTRLPLNRNE